MASNVLRKINVKLKLFYLESMYLIPGFRRLLCKVLIQPHLCMFFMAACFRKNLKIKLQKTRNKYIRFCLNFLPRSHIDPSHIRKPFCEDHFQVLERNYTGIFIKCLSHHSCSIVYIVTCQQTYLFRKQIQDKNGHFSFGQKYRQNKP